MIIHYRQIEMVRIKFKLKKQSKNIKEKYWVLDLLIVLITQEVINL